MSDIISDISYLLDAVFDITTIITSHMYHLSPNRCVNAHLKYVEQGTPTKSSSSILSRVQAVRSCSLWVTVCDAIVHSFCLGLVDIDVLW